MYPAVTRQQWRSKWSMLWLEKAFRWITKLNELCNILIQQGYKMFLYICICAEYISGLVRWQNRGCRIRKSTFAKTSSLNQSIWCRLWNSFHSEKASLGACVGLVRSVLYKNTIQITFSLVFAFHKFLKYYHKDEIMRISPSDQLQPQRPFSVSMCGLIQLLEMNQSLYDDLIKRQRVRSNIVR